MMMNLVKYFIACSVVFMTSHAIAADAVKGEHITAMMKLEAVDYHRSRANDIEPPAIVNLRNIGFFDKPITTSTMISKLPDGNWFDVTSSKIRATDSVILTYVVYGSATQTIPHVTPAVGAFLIFEGETKLDNIMAIRKIAQQNDCGYFQLGKEDNAKFEKPLIAPTNSRFAIDCTVSLDAINVEAFKDIEESLR